MSVIDLQQMREQRATTKSATYQEAIDNLDRSISALTNLTDLESAKQLAKLADQKATMISKLDRAIEQEKRAEAKAAREAIPLSALEAQLEAEVRSLLKEYDLRFVEKNNRYWLHYPSKYENDVFVPSQWIPIRKSDLNHYHTDLEPKASNDFWRVFQSVMKSDGRRYHDMVYSFDKVPSTTLNMLRKDFLPRQQGEPHWLFDELLNSLSGGKKENRDHIEQIIVATYLDPAGNYLRPCQVFDDPGSTGKTLFASRVLTTLFGSDLVIQSVDIESLNGFNAHIAGKVVVFINEVSQETEHSNILRRILGSRRFKLEFKGVDATFADNTAIYFISGNNRGVGAVHFSNNGIDRRYSMHCPEKPLWTYVQGHLTEDDMTTPGSAGERVESWMRRVGQNILSDPNEVGKWINSLIERHGEVTDVGALHGADYQKIVTSQKATHIKVFETIFDDVFFQYIKRKTLYEFFKNEEPTSRMRRDTFYSLADDWIKNHAPHIVLKNAVSWGSSSADVYYNSAKKNAISNNDGKYREVQEYGRVKWLVELPS